jgi:uncharacterized delta-60 repeat protein
MKRSLQVSYYTLYLRTVLLLIPFILHLTWFTGDAARAASGDPDPIFGQSGRVTIDFNNSTDRASAVAIQTDGKIVVGGFAFSNSDTSTSVDQFALVRLNDDGSLDNGFGTAGRATADFGGLVNEAKAVAVQSDGKIVAAGFVQTPQGGYDFGLARFNSNGSLDSTFGLGGKVTTDFSGFSDFAYSVILRPDGRIVVGGSSQNERSFDFALARYDSNGILDSAFGSGGKVTLDFFGREDEALAMAVQSDGKIVAAGYVGGAGQLEDFGLARFNADGSVDSTFGTNGKVATDFGFSDKILAVVIQQDGKIVGAGYARDNTDLNYGFALARYHGSGARDKQFGTKGKVLTHFSNGNDEVHALALDRAGRLIAAGQANIGFAVARYQSNGRLDLTFGTNGVVGSPFTTAFGPSSANAVAIETDGKIVAAGVAYPSGSNDFAVARFQTAVPSISTASISRKNLVVSGENFDVGAIIVLDGADQRTINDSEKPASVLIGKKVGKKIAPGQQVTLRVRNPDGAISAEFPFTR